MNKLVACAFTAILVASLISYAAEGANPRVKIETTKGTFVVELFPKAAPKTVANFLQYANDGFYNGTIFHRVIKNFMVQGGGFTKDMSEKPTRPPVVNEADNGLKNTVGTLAMARTNDPNSATGQFFINVKDNAFLNFRSKDEQGWGYCVFGRVVTGLSVVTAIENEPTANSGMFQDVPVTPVVMTKVSLVEDATGVKAGVRSVKDTVSEKAK
jgi:cyclophilin family peptidyl-prolyl cis-trans isomerase